MKRQFKHTTRIIAAAIIALTGCPLLPAWHPQPSASAQTANSPSDALPALQGEQAIRQLKEQGLYDSLQQAADAARYELRWEERPTPGHLPPAYHAPNPAQRLSAYFTPAGLYLAPHGAKSEAGGHASAQAEWRAGMRLIGYGYGDHLAPVGEAEVVARGNRVEYRRAWPRLAEWYVNKAGGLEQGFTVDTPPGIRSEGEQLRLALEVTGDLSVELTEGSQAVALKQADGGLALSYSDLHACDARGRELPSQMRVSGGRVFLEVDDEQAVYPVIIDPTFTQQAELLASDGAAGDCFGSAVAVYADTAVVGSPFDDTGSNQRQGSAYVFVRSNGFWSQQAKLTANGGAAGDCFGSAVAIYWDTIVVGAHESFQSPTGQGSAYVFVRSNGFWSQQAKLTASDGASADQFGFSVAIDAYTGNTVVVGAPSDDIVTNGISNADQGSAYVFVRSNGAWSQQQKLTDGNGAAGDSFGFSVASEAYTTGTVVVGAPRSHILANGMSNADQGSACVFVRSNGAWGQQAKLTASDGAAGDQFGYSVAISGTGKKVVVGACFDDIVTNGVSKADQGSAYVFVRSNGFWSQEAKLIASDGASGDWFGHSVAISGYEVVVGAPHDDISANANQGSAYVFVYSNGAWSLEAKLTASGGAAGDWFGYSVAINSGTTSTVVVGAPGNDIVANGMSSADQGSAHVFVR